VADSHLHGLLPYTSVVQGAGAKKAGDGPAKSMRDEPKRSDLPKRVKANLQWDEHGFFVRSQREYC